MEYFFSSFAHLCQEKGSDFSITSQNSVRFNSYTEDTLNNIVMITEHEKPRPWLRPPTLLLSQRPVTYEVSSVCLFPDIVLLCQITDKDLLI